MKKIFAPLVYILMLGIASCKETKDNNTTTSDLNPLFIRPSEQTKVGGKYIYKSVAELGAMLREGSATASDITKEFIAHIKNNNYKYNAVAWLREKEALKDAAYADSLFRKGKILSPLQGIPVTVKEEYWIKGSPVTLNSNLFKNFIAPEDGELVKQYIKAGAVILGKTNVPALLFDFQVQGDIYPVGSNPYDTAYSPGGSTGGGAAALAAGFTTLELGSDLGGSVRLPSTYCGLYGLKTTFGSLNITESSGPDTASKKKRFALNTAGPLARSPEDLEAAWLVLRDAKPDPHFNRTITWEPATGKRLQEYKIAWIDDWPDGKDTIRVGMDVKKKLHPFIQQLTSMGCTMVKTVPQTYHEMMKSYLTCIALMSGEGQPKNIIESIKKDMAIWDDGSGTLNTFYSAVEQANDQNWQKWQSDNNRLIAKWDKFFNEYDFLICPVTYGPAIKKSPKGTPVKIDGTTVSYFNYATFTMIFNPVGVPCITIPLGLNKEGLPVGVQIVSKRYSEPELLHIAKLLASITPGFVRPRN